VRMKIHWVSLWAACFAVSGCDSSTGGSGPKLPSFPVAATISLTGAVGGTYAGVVTVGSAPANMTEFDLAGPITGSGTSIGGFVRFPGLPTPQSYTEADSGDVAGMSVTVSSTLGNRSWTQSRDVRGITGSYTLTLNAVSPAVTGATGTVYVVHGTIDAVLRGLSPADGSTVNLHATF
jgi:hypothetical protein